MRNVIAVFAVSGMVILASCAGNRSQGTHSSAMVMTGNEAYVTELPAECANTPTQENIMNDGQVMMVKCSCNQSGRLAEWYNTVNPQIDPADYCHAPSNGLVFRSNMTVAVSTTVASSSVLPPPPPVNAPPAPTASASAPPPEQTPPGNSLKVSDLKYRCNGTVAEREYKTVEEHAGSRTTTAISQQCVGEGLVCLTDPAQQRDTSQPPCGCADGLRLTILSGQHRTWGCQSL